MSERRRRLAAASCVFLVLSVASCGGNASSTTQPGDDASEDAFVPDANVDTAPDASADTAPEADTNDADADAPDVACLPNQTTCPSGCANLDSDNANCGACGVVCSGGLMCAMGVCSPTCTTPQSLCPAPDAGSDAADASDASAADASDASDAASTDAGDADASDDADAGDADANDADAAPPTPTGPYCATLGSDPQNCGTCGNACPGGANAMPSCASGTCGLACNASFADCDKNASNGCEIDTSQDTANCGTCGNACPGGANASAACAAGKCALACSTGFADCDNLAVNGCETNTNNDANNCGACANVCPSGPHSTPNCVSAACAITCDGGYTDCDANPSTGCEVHTAVDPANCGTCGSACVTPNATPYCASGMCGITQCNPGFVDCNGVVSDGCETNELSDPNNCGGCGIKCTIANGVGACVNGACAVAVCNTGYQDCDHVVSDGCETHTSGDPNNCGTCGNVCQTANGTPSCNGGSCTIASCNAGYNDCNNQPGDGCETQVSSDPTNCGTCGFVCNVPNGTPGCSNGACTVVSCNAGFANCNGSVLDGCETNITNNDLNCGGCGFACPSACVGHVGTTSCSASQCQITGCIAGYTNFDGACADGCECPLSTTPTSCSGAFSFGSLPPLSASVTHTSNLIPAVVGGGVPNSAWYTVTFTGNTDVTNYHPKITLTDPTGEFVMDVMSDCSGTLLSTCGDGGVTQGVTTFEDSYSGVNPGANPNSRTPSGVSNFIPIPLSTVYVHVYRKNSANVTCNQYTLTASN